MAPHRVVDPRYVSYTAILEKGQVVEGLIEGESAGTLRFRLVDGSERAVLRSDVRTLTSSGRSLMPEGLELGLSLRDVADLIEFARTR